MRHLVTGNAGFIGSWIADALIDQGDEVWGMDNFSGGKVANLNPDAENLNVDLIAPITDNGVLWAGRPEEIVGYCFTDNEWVPDVLWHLAADATEGRSQFTPRSAVMNNAVAYMNTLIACIDAWKEIGGIENKKVVLFSSMSVYGDQKPPFDERMPRRPVDVYGGAKTYMEQMTEALADVHGFRYTIIRPHNVFGPRQRLDDPYRNVVGIFLNRIMRREPILIYGDGRQRRAFSYITNSLPCYLRCLDGDTDGEVYNIGGTRDISIRALAAVVEDAMDTKAEIVHVPDRPREVKEAYATYQKSIDRLGFDEPVKLEQGVALMAAWAREQGPQEWEWQPLELDSEKAPLHWRTQGKKHAIRESNAQ